MASIRPDTERVLSTAALALPEHQTKRGLTLPADSRARAQSGEDGIMAAARSAATASAKRAARESGAAMTGCVAGKAGLEDDGAAETNDSAADG